MANQAMPDNQGIFGDFVLRWQDETKKQSAVEDRSPKTYIARDLITRKKFVTGDNDRNAGHYDKEKQSQPQIYFAFVHHLMLLQFGL